MTTRAVATMVCALLSATLLLRAEEPVPKTNADGQPVPVETATDAKSTTDSKAVAGQAPAEPEYNNWIELSIGGLITSGDVAQFEQQHHMSGDVFGGIHNLHYEQTVDKTGQF